MYIGFPHSNHVKLSVFSFSFLLDGFPCLNKVLHYTSSLAFYLASESSDHELDTVPRTQMIRTLFLTTCKGGVMA